jgi:exodeoxyribonuclease VII small subunit
MAEPSFEKALEKLEKIVGDLESGDISLDEALQRYEEGVKLVRLCNKKLDTAQKKVEILLKSGKGSVDVGLFDEKKALEDDKEHAD